MKSQIISKNTSASEVTHIAQGMRYEFGSLGAVCSVEEMAGSQNLQVKKIYGPAAPMLQHSLLHTIAQVQSLRTGEILPILSFYFTQIFTQNYTQNEHVFLYIFVLFSKYFCHTVDDMICISDDMLHVKPLYNMYIRMCLRT